MKIIQKICFSVFLIIIVFLSIGCQKKIDKKFYPYQFNAEKFKTINRKVLLVPTGLFDVIPYDSSYTPIGTTELCELIDESLRLYLQNNNYEVIYPENIKPIWLHFKNKIGFFDPVGGKVSVKKYLKVVDQSVLKLRKENEFDSVIIPNLEFKSIPMQKNIYRSSAVWDGVQRKSLKTNDHGNFTHHVVVSLKVNIKSYDLNDIFFSKGGIDVVTYRKTTYHPSTVMPFITKKVMRNVAEISQEKVLESISIALHPFVRSDYHDTKKISSY
jgi:hypothetical protein